ncbi:Major Facilitator Superfamily protein [uncultured archaeon]|nr:Major Facilitator Superfamily protein [uncultured archaeon]
MGWISKDGKLILITRGIRSFGYGFISVLLGIYLTELGFKPFLVGILLSAAIAGGALFTIITGRYAVIYGLKKMLLSSIILSLLGIAIFLITENFIFLILGAMISFLSPSGRELGPFLSLEQAYLPFTVSDDNRTKAFSFWNIIATFSASVGTLLGSLPLFLQGYFGIEKILSFKLMFAFYLILNMIALLLYASISEVKFTREKIKLTEKSKKIITKLSFLFAIDSLGGGFVITSILSLWFYSKFNTPLTTISAIFFAAGLLEALSYYLSEKLAKKIGLVNTMVFTHIPSSIFLILIPFAPNFYLAVALLLLRQLLSEMDVPPRQSYVVAMVNPEEKSIATSTTNLAKILASSIGPAVAGRVLFLTAFSPFVIGGSLKIIYDVILYFDFRNLKPPEEKN